MIRRKKGNAGARSLTSTARKRDATASKLRAFRTGGQKTTTGGLTARFGRASYGVSSARSRMRHRMHVRCVYFRFALAAAAAICLVNQAAGQQSSSAAPHAVTTSDYQGAE